MKLTQNNKVTDALYKEMQNLADEIINDAFKPNNCIARWLSVSGNVEASQFRVSAGDLNYFNGWWGIVTALEAANYSLTKVFGKSHLDTFLEEQAHNLSTKIKVPSSSHFRCIMPQIGISGLAGKLRAQSKLQKLRPDRWGFLEQKMTEDLQLACNLAHNDKCLDVINGAAGLSLVCDEIMLSNSNKNICKIALMAKKISVNNILDRIEKIDGMNTWIIPGQKRPLLGFAHGWAGIVSSIASDLSFVSGKKKSGPEKLRDALAFPSKVKLRDAGWIDHRVEDVAPSGQNNKLNQSWCNGLSGLVVGLQNAAQHFNYDYDEEIENILRDLEPDHDENSCYRYCCGQFGVIDTLNVFARRRGDDNIGLRNRAVSAVRKFRTINKNRHIDTVPETSFAGLYQGKSGILHTITCLVDNEVDCLTFHNRYEF